MHSAPVCVSWLRVFGKRRREAICIFLRRGVSWSLWEKRVSAVLLSGGAWSGAWCMRNANDFPPMMPASCVGSDAQKKGTGSCFCSTHVHFFLCVTCWVIDVSHVCFLCFWLKSKLNVELGQSKATAATGIKTLWINFGKLKPLLFNFVGFQDLSQRLTAKSLYL